MQITPTIAVVGSFMLLVVAAVVFAVVFARSRRASHDNGARHHQPAAAHLARGRSLDTSLEGLDLDASDDAPSAVLLAPLRESEWAPPECPAPPEELSAASLEGRIAGYEPPPEIPEPSFALDQHPEWQVARVPSATDSALVSPLEQLVPEVRLPAPVPTLPVAPPAFQSPAETADDFDAEIAALLPVDDLPAQITGGPKEAPMPAEPPAPIPAPMPVEPPEPIPAPMPPPAPMPAPMPAEPAAEPAAAPVPVRLPERVSDPEPEMVPPVAAEPEPTADPVPRDQSESMAELADDAFWSGLLAEQQVEQRPRTESVPARPAESTPTRPAVRVTTAEPPVAEPAPPIRESQVSVRPRATVRIHAIPEGEGANDDASAMLAPVPAGPRDSDIADMVLETPVEIWFGDSRIGVKPGTATYDKFKRYADALLADLNESVTPADKV